VVNPGKGALPHLLATFFQRPGKHDAPSREGKYAHPFAGLLWQLAEPDTDDIRKPLPKGPAEIIFLNF